MRAPRVLVILTAVAFAIAVPVAAGAAETSSPVDPWHAAVEGDISTGVDPVVGACVTLGPPFEGLTTQTDVAGHYAFTNVIPEPVTLILEVDPSCSSDPKTADYVQKSTFHVQVSAGHTTTADFILSVGGAVAGTLLDSSGAPLAGACVSLVGSGFSFGDLKPIRSDATGHYILRGIAPGNYELTIDGCYSGANDGPDIQPEYYNEGVSGVLDEADAPFFFVVANATTSLEPQETRAGADITLSLDADPVPASAIRPVVLVHRLPYTDLFAWGYVTWDPKAVVWKITKLIPGEYKLGYQYCDPSQGCRGGFVGYYKGIGVDGSLDDATPINAQEGEDAAIDDHVVVPPLSSSSVDVWTEQDAVEIGHDITMSVQVKAASGGHIPSGWIYPADSDSADGLPVIQPVPLGEDGRATFTWTAEAGKHTINVWYGGDGATDYSTDDITITDGKSSNVRSTGGGGGAGGGVPPVSQPVSGTVGDGGSLSSDPPGTTPNESNPLVVDVATPAGGTISIDKTAPNTSVAGYRVLNVGATITAPTASASDPLRLTFQVYAGSLPEGSYGSDLTVFRDGVAVGECAGPDVADPDPCVAQRSTSAGVTTITVLSSHASAWDVEAANVGRIGGADRIGTAVAVSRDSFPSGGAGAVVLARADDYPDALVGAPLAAQKNAPLLLTQGAALPSATREEIARVLPKGQTVYVLGGPAAVPDSVVAQLQGDGYVVVRYGGADRYATAVAVADALGDPATVLLATGANFPDALAAGPAAAHLRAAVLLTNGDNLPTATSTYLTTRAGTVYAVGGPAAAADPSAIPVFGADRYATAAAVATTFFGSPATVGIATALTFADALSGGAQLALADSPLLLANPQSAPSATTAYLTGMNANLTTAHVYGGPAALSDAVLTQLRDILNG